MLWSWIFGWKNLFVVSSSAIMFRRQKSFGRDANSSGRLSYYVLIVASSYPKVSCHCECCQVQVRCCKDVLQSSVYSGAVGCRRSRSHQIRIVFSHKWAPGIFSFRISNADIYRRSYKPSLGVCSRDGADATSCCRGGSSVFRLRGHTIHFQVNMSADSTHNASYASIHLCSGRGTSDFTESQAEDEYEVGNSTSNETKTWTNSLRQNSF